MDYLCIVDMNLLSLPYKENFQRECHFIYLSKIYIILLLEELCKFISDMNK